LGIALTFVVTLNEFLGRLAGVKDPEKGAKLIEMICIEGLERAAEAFGQESIGKMEGLAERILYPAIKEGG
jgi:GMP synthase PP-ATPase subunit